MHTCKSEYMHVHCVLPYTHRVWGSVGISNHTDAIKSDVPPGVLWKSPLRAQCFVFSLPGTWVVWRQTRSWSFCWDAPLDCTCSCSLWWWQSWLYLAHQLTAHTGGNERQRERERGGGGRGEGKRKRESGKESVSKKDTEAEKESNLMRDEQWYLCHFYWLLSLALNVNFALEEVKLFHWKETRTKMPVNLNKAIRTTLFLLLNLWNTCEHTLCCLATVLMRKSVRTLSTFGTRMEEYSGTESLG